jgi:hypothetical protein
MNYRIKEVHISLITAGDTVLINEDIKTVCKNNLGECPFIGRTLFGDSYQSGHKPVQQVIIHKAMPSKVIPAITH